MLCDNGYLQQNSYMMQSEEMDALVMECQSPIHAPPFCD